MNGRLELRCSRDLALRLGAVAPLSVGHHRELFAAGGLLVRDPVTAWPLFWPWQTSSAPEPTRSSQ